MNFLTKIFYQHPLRVIEDLAPVEAMKRLSIRLGLRNSSDRTPVEHLVWNLNVLHSEAMNGTLEQYATNSSGDLFARTKTSMKQIRAKSGERILDDLDKMLNGCMSQPRSVRIETVGSLREKDETFLENGIRKLTIELEEEWPEICRKATEWIRVQHSDEDVF